MTASSCSTAALARTRTAVASHHLLLAHTCLPVLYFSASSNSATCQLLHLGQNNPMQQRRSVKEQLESCMAEKDLRVLVNSWSDLSQQYAQEAKTVYCILACNGCNVSSRTREVMITLFSDLLRPQL